MRPATKADGSHIRKARLEHRHKQHDLSKQHSRKKKTIHLAKHGLRAQRDNIG